MSRSTAKGGGVFLRRGGPGVKEEECEGREDPVRVFLHLYESISGCTFCGSRGRWGEDKKTSGSVVLKNFSQQIWVRGEGVEGE